MDTGSEDRATADMSSLFAKFYMYIQRMVSADIDGLQYYLSNPVWIPSLCAAVPHASVLTYSGTLITYLLNLGFSLNIVTIARFTGAVFEIASTFVYPWAVRVLSKGNSTTGVRYELVPQYMFTSSAESPRDKDPEERTEGSNHNSSTSELGVVRVGLCGILTLCLSLVSTAWFWDRYDSMLIAYAKRLLRFLPSWHSSLSGPSHLR